MRLYTRGQLLTAAIPTVLAAVILTAFITIKVSGFKKNNSAKTEENVVYNELQQNSNTVSYDDIDYLDEEASYTSSDINNYSNSNDDVVFTRDEIQNIKVYEACNEAVVNINTQVTTYDWFLEPYVTDGGSGSGAIIDERGYILTNVHVIKDATKIYVSLFDGTQYEAEVIGQDLDSDLAVIRFTPPEGMVLKTISFGDSSKLKVGQKVIAIGNPFGLERTMTTGIVSGLGRPIQDTSTNRIIRNMVQTDAAINPGNSGGPLLDTNGKIVGINTMIVSSSGSSAGLGFAVPSETAKRVVADLINYGKVQRGQIDAKLVQMTRRIAQLSGMGISSGMMVSEVTKGGKAEKAGLKPGTEAAYYGSFYGSRNVIYLKGDVIVQIDGIKVATLVDYYSALESKKPGDKVKVVVYRNGEYRELEITLVD